MAPVNTGPIYDFLFTRTDTIVDTPSSAAPAADLRARSDALLPTAVHELETRTISARDGDNTPPAGQGSVPATSFNNSAFFALFAILGAVMVIATMWFFFWAKNGGFHWQQGDWDDYKSTVLRRKGPDGKTLSNATKSTKLGGGSIAGTQHYKWQQQAARSVIGYDEKGRKGVLGKRGFAGTHSITYSDDYMTDSLASKSVTDEMTEVNTAYNAGDGHHSKRYRDRDVQQYKKEKPARVGGLNRTADGSHFGTSSDRSDTYTETSEQPILSKTDRKAAQAERERKDAERRAKNEAARMERRWKKEAEAAAAALARESAPPPPPAHRKSAAPVYEPLSQPMNAKTRRTGSPKKRDFSFDGPESERLSTAYTPSERTGSERTASYYDAYRPRHADGYNSDAGRRARQSSPKKAGKKRSEGGYRRGADDDFE